MNYSKKVGWLITVSTIARLVVASTTELGNDEVYYFTYAQYLQPGYFDHPPLVAWLIRVTTCNLLLTSEVFVRLGAIIGSGISTYLIYITGTLLYNRQAGWYAALLFTSSLYCSIIAGTFILPDSPQLVFWLWSLLLLLKISKLGLENKKGTQLWCLFGLSAGLCIMSKVHGVFLWFGASLYVLFLERRWLKNKALYLSVLISVLIVSPLIFWNIQNNFISYAFHSDRVTIANTQIHFDSFVRELTGSILYNNPFTFFLIWKAVIARCKRKSVTSDNQILLLLFCSLPLILVLLTVSLFKDTLPHWSGPAYMGLIFLPAIKLAVSTEKVSKPPAIIRAALFFISIVIISGIGIIHFYPGTLSANKQELNLGEGDPTLDLRGWKRAGNKINSLYSSDTMLHIIPAGATIIVDNWFPAAHIEYYIASKTGQQTYALGTIFDLHHFHWLNAHKKQINKGDAAYYIVPSNVYRKEALDTIRKKFDSTSAPVIIPEYRNGIICRKFYVYRLKGFH